MKLFKLFFVVAMTVAGLSAFAQTIDLATLGSLNGTNGANTRTALTEGTNGNFYGVGYTGGPNDLGTIFELPPSGPPTLLYTFSGGASSAHPTAPLLLGRDGYLYGEMPFGGANNLGYIFRMSHAGVLTNIASFDGYTGLVPSGGLIQGQDGNFYGTCQQAGGEGPNFYGCIFRMTPDGTLSNLHAFAGTNNGSTPYAGLVQAADGFLYGTTLLGGTNGNFGTIFKLDTNGVFTSLFSFNKTNGANPRATLAPGLDGNLYGTTVSGGTNIFNAGTIFRITPSGNFTSLASFDGDISASPYGGLTPDGNGNFYGTTYSGEGTIFQVTTNGMLTTIYAFTADEDFNYPNGTAPQGTLVQGTDGRFYGTTSYGGDYDLGTVFSFSVASPAPVFQSVGQAGGVLTFTWSTVSNSNYQVQSSTNLMQANWADLGDPVNATNSVMSGTDVIGLDAQKFYRVRLLP